MGAVLGAGRRRAPAQVLGPFAGLQPPARTGTRAHGWARTFIPPRGPRGPQERGCSARSGAPKTVVAHTYTFPRTCVLLTTKVNNSLSRSPATPSLRTQPPLVCLTHLTEDDGRARCCGVVLLLLRGCREFRRAPIRGGSKGPLTEWYLCVLRFEPALLLVLHPKSGGATQQRARTCTIIAQKQLSLLKSANVSAPCCVVVKGYHFLNAVDSSLYRTCCRGGAFPVTVGGAPTVVSWA